jgi:hypothetical protein
MPKYEYWVRDGANVVRKTDDFANDESADENVVDWWGYSVAKMPRQIGPGMSVAQRKRRASKFKSLSDRSKIRASRKGKRNKSERPVVMFRKKNGGLLRKRFKSRASAARAVNGWRKRGGEVVGVSHSSASFNSRSAKYG